MLSEEEFVDEEARQARGVVAKDTVLFDEVAGNEANFQLQDFVAIEQHWFGTLSAITAGDFRRDRLEIGDDGVNDAGGDVMVDGTKMIAESVMSGFAGLGHEIGDVDAGSSGASDGVSNLGDEQVGDDTGVERAGPHEDEVRLLDGLDGRGERTDAAWVQPNFTNGHPAAGNARFALHALAVGKSSDQMHVGKRGRKDPATNSEDFARDADGFGKVTRHMGKSGQEEIAEIVATQATAGVEAILEKPTEKGFVLGECHHAVTDVAGGKHAIFAAETAGTATVIGDRNDGGEVRDGALYSGVLIAAANHVVL